MHSYVDKILFLYKVGVTVRTAINGVPHTTVLSSSLAPELAPTMRLQLLPRRLSARPPRRCSHSGEDLDRSPVLQFPSIALGHHPRAPEQP
jgi:hypothetical protein